MANFVFRREVGELLLCSCTVGYTHGGEPHMINPIIHPRFQCNNYANEADSTEQYLGTTARVV